jgi:hypothetical protein
MYRTTVFLESVGLSRFVGVGYMLQEELMHHHVFKQHIDLYNSFFYILVFAWANDAG